MGQTISGKKNGRGEAKGRRALDASLVEGQEGGWEEFETRKESVPEEERAG